MIAWDTLFFVSIAVGVGCWIGRSKWFDKLMKDVGNYLLDKIE